MILHVLIAMVAGWLQRHQQQVITYLRENWLRVFRRADAARRGVGARPQGHTKAVRPEQCGVCRGTTSARNAPGRHGVWPACS
jgi:hypothetical protein